MLPIMVPEPEEGWPAFTPDQARALGECRFVTVGGERSWMLALTKDETVAKAVGLRALPQSRQQWSDPTDTEWEIFSHHPEAVATAARIMEARR